MTIRRRDGSVQSANTPKSEGDFLIRDARIFKCIITRVYYSDDPKNITRASKNPEVVYDAVIVGGLDEGQFFHNIRDAAFLSGGKTNYSERVYRACSKPLTGNNAVALGQQDGDHVYVALVNGDRSCPIIVGAATHYLDGNLTGATKSQGPTTRWEYNGIFCQVDKNGNLTLRRKGGSFNGTSFEPLAGGKKVDIQISESKLIRSYAGGLIVTEDGSSDVCTISTAGGAVAKIDGKANKVTITAGAAIVEIDGNSGKISLKAEMVDLGKSVVDLVTLFSEMANIFNTHTHMAPQAPAGVLPTTPPMSPMLVTAGSNTVKVQA